MEAKVPETTEETLDPGDWDGLQSLAHQVVDDAIAHVRNVRDRPVWRDMPAEVRDAFTASAPSHPQPLADVYHELHELLMPYPMGNIHPRFWMWYMGAGSVTGALAEFLAAIDGSNLGGGNNAAALMDRQVVDWLRQMTGFPDSAGGTLVSGGSMANIIGLTAARNAMAGIDVRSEGVAAMPQPLRFYGSDQLHSCHQKAVELLGLGNKALRRVPTGPDFRMDVSALEDMIAEDRNAGFRPACVIATAGTVNTGAIDDLPGINALCRKEGLWFHVDGCIGALIAIAPENRHLVSGLEMADSIALDPHKWLHVPFEAGCALVRDATTHRNTFAVHPEYLEGKPRGIAACEYLHDYNLQTSRAFRALKIWLTLKEHGIDKFGRLINQNIAQARYLSGLIERTPDLQLVAPTAINIVCFRHDPGARPEAELCDLNTEIMLRMQETGVAAVSDTSVAGHHCLRVAICNHRTRREDLDLLVQEVSRIGGVLVRGESAGAGNAIDPSAAEK
ncbi:pyridoxal phosphate-dependent decarboxylase family protein [Pukyongiella litopenaei]|uniref:Aspartate aminotransferase family protein n=1 Tax=Pukyongiella litopenaei TaxID=2605946 RepID=A0A2S0MP85_9RHOB|nr:aspartate aminotransferase family protein [Pukyongiella litopenaei]AVO37533.1 aspartate aminotransferase family protein [Pukyongiella litopenaei]